MTCTFGFVPSFYILMIIFAFSSWHKSLISLSFLFILARTFSFHHKSFLCLGNMPPQLPHLGMHSFIALSIICLKQVHDSGVVFPSSLLIKFCSLTVFFSFLFKLAVVSFQIIKSCLRLNFSPCNIHCQISEPDDDFSQKKPDEPGPLPFLPH